MKRRDFIAMSPAFPVAATTATLTVRTEGEQPVELDVSVLKLQPGDTLVIKARGQITQEEADRVSLGVGAMFQGVKVVVLDDALSIEGVLRGPA